MEKKTNKIANCIVELTLDERGEPQSRIEGHHIESNNCKDCGLYLSDEWIKKNITDNVWLTVNLHPKEGESVLEFA